MHRVLICGLAHNAEQWLPRNIATLDGLTYPKELLSYSYVEGGSSDTTLSLLASWLMMKQRFTLVKHDYPLSMDERERTWLSMQIAFKALDDEDYLFLCDSDVISIPPDTLQRLLDKQVDIIHPYIYVDKSFPGATPEKLFYDSWAFRFSDCEWDNSSYTATKMIATADPLTGLIAMDSVGANPVLIRREVVEEVSYSGNADILGFCVMAKRLGFQIYSYPAVECYHAWESI